jgi:hypothetical protein
MGSRGCSRCFAGVARNWEFEGDVFGHTKGSFSQINDDRRFYVLARSRPTAPSLLGSHLREEDIEEIADPAVRVKDRSTHRAVSRVAVGVVASSALGIREHFIGR